MTADARQLWSRSPREPQHTPEDSGSARTRKAASPLGGDRPDARWDASPGGAALREDPYAPAQAAAPPTPPRRPDRPAPAGHWASPPPGGAGTARPGLEPSPAGPATPRPVSGTVETPAAHAAPEEAPISHPTATPRPPTRRAAPGRGRWRELWAFAAVAGVAAAIGTVVLASRDDAPPPTVAFRVAGHPTAIAAHGGRLWVAAPDAGAVWVLDAASGRPAGPPLRTRGAPTRVALQGDRPWVADAARGEVLPPGRGPVRVGPDVADIAVGGAVAWVASTADGMVRALGPRGAPLVALRVGVRPIAVAAGERYVAVADAGAGTVVRIAADSRRLTGVPVRIGGVPVALALAPDDVAWVVDGTDDAVVRIDLRTGQAAGSPVPVGGSPVAIAADGRDVYVVCRADRTLVRLDPATGQVRRRLPLRATPTALTLDPRHIWVVSADAGLVTRIDR